MTRLDFRPENVGGRATSIAEWVCRMGQRARKAWLDKVSKRDMILLRHCWAFWVRRDQRPPQGNWKTWLVLAGRGFGKTRMGAEWVKRQARRAKARIALLGATSDEVRRVMVEGESGILANCRECDRPVWEPSLGRLRWPNGATAHVFSAAEPDSLRGPQFDAAWCDEIAKWPRGEEAWANLEFTMRLGSKPQIMATTTPRGVPLVRRLVAAAG